MEGLGLTRTMGNWWRTCRRSGRVFLLLRQLPGLTEDRCVEVDSLEPHFIFTFILTELTGEITVQWEPLCMAFSVLMLVLSIVRCRITEQFGNVLREEHTLNLLGSAGHKSQVELLTAAVCYSIVVHVVLKTMYNCRVVFF